MTVTVESEHQVRPPQITNPAPPSGLETRPASLIELHIEKPQNPDEILAHSKLFFQTIEKVLSTQKNQKLMNEYDHFVNQFKKTLPQAKKEEVEAFLKTLNEKQLQLLSEKETDEQENLDESKIASKEAKMMKELNSLEWLDEASRDEVVRWSRLTPEQASQEYLDELKKGEQTKYNQFLQNLIESYGVDPRLVILLSIAAGIVERASTIKTMQKAGAPVHLHSMKSLFGFQKPFVTGKGESFILEARKKLLKVRHFPKPPKSNFLKEMLIQMLTIMIEVDLHFLQALETSIISTRQVEDGNQPVAVQKEQSQAV